MQAATGCFVALLFFPCLPCSLPHILSRVHALHSLTEGRLVPTSIFRKAFLVRSARLELSSAHSAGSVNRTRSHRGSDTNAQSLAA